MVDNWAVVQSVAETWLQERERNFDPSIAAISAVAAVDEISQFCRFFLSVTMLEKKRSAAFVEATKELCMGKDLSDWQSLAVEACRSADGWAKLERAALLSGGYEKDHGAALEEIREKCANDTLPTEEFETLITTSWKQYKTNFRKERLQSLSSSMASWPLLSDARVMSG